MPLKCMADRPCTPNHAPYLPLFDRESSSRGTPRILPDLDPDRSGVDTL